MRVNLMLNSGGGKEANNVSLQNKKAILDTEPNEFNKALSGATVKSHREDLDLLMKEVTKKAEKLAKSCTIQDLRDYKRSVREFLKETMGKAYQAQDGMGWDSAGKHKLFILIKKVDERLEELSIELIQDQKDNLELLNRLDEIRGLLVDMYL